MSPYLCPNFKTFVLGIKKWFPYFVPCMGLMTKCLGIFEYLCENENTFYPFALSGA
jgi:hypothetical protein